MSKDIRPALNINMLGDSVRPKMRMVQRLHR